MAPHRRHSRDWVAPPRKTVYKITRDCVALRCLMIRSLLAVLLALCFCVATSFAQSSPCSLSDHTEDINAYFRLLASKSPRVKVWSIGTSEEGREMLVAAVFDEANLAKLDRYKEITARLADPRGLTEAEAQKLMAEGKPIYWADGSIHSPETGSPEMLMELAYRLAVEDTPFIQKIRRDSI